MLDVYYLVYLWFGSKSKDITKTVAMTTAQNYVNQANDGRPKNTSGTSSIPIVVVKQPYQEPHIFTQFFFGWSKSLFPRDKVRM